MAKQVWDDPQITSYVLGELTPQELIVFERRLASDPKLRQAVEEAARITRELTDVFSQIPLSGLAPERRATVEQAIRGDLPVSNEVTVSPIAPSAIGGGFKKTSWLAIAATVMLIGGVSLSLLALGPGRHFVAMDAAPVATESAAVSPGNSRGLTVDALPQEAVAASESEVPQEPSAKAFAAVEATDMSLFEERDGLRDSLAELDLKPERALQEASPPRPASSPAAASPSSAQSRMDSVDKKMQSDLPPALKEVQDKRRAEGIDDYAAGGFGLPKDTYREKSLEESRRGSSAANSELSDMINPAADAPFGTAVAPAAPTGAALPESESVFAPESRSLRFAPVPHDAHPMADPFGGEHVADRFGNEDEGKGPGQAGDRFALVTDNEFLRVTEAPLSTFSIDVDTASYSKTRQFLLEANQLPRPDAVRIEELVNYFSYDYAPPAEQDEHPFAVHVDVTECPWQPKHRLARIGLKGRALTADRPRSNLVFLLDVSGSMDEPNKLPLVVRGMRMLLGELDERDRVAIVVYAGAAGLVLDSTPADRRDKILDALERLKAGGSTNGGQGIELAYRTARENFIEKGTNRVILCSDGDFNVGTTGTDQLVRMVENEAKDHIFLTVLGFGMGNHNDAMLEQVSGRGNGNYAFIDTAAEARKVLVHQVSGTLVTIAKDVKIQVEFNPQQIAGYRLIGYENRVLAAQDFNDDKKDAGEIGAGHEVTALYELVPTGQEITGVAPPVDDLRYQKKSAVTEAATSQELMAVKLRYKQPEGDTSILLEHPVSDKVQSFDQVGSDVRFAAAVAGFGMQLRQSPHKGTWTWKDVSKTAAGAIENDRYGLRGEFLELVQIAERLAGRQKAKTGER